MATLQDPAYLDGGCITAQGDRQVLASLVCTEGVTPNAGGELEVTQRGAGANMSVDVASGNGFVEGTEAGWQGMYHVSNDGTVNLVIAAADPTDDRIDIVVATVRDAAYSGTDSDWLLQVVTGTPSPSPTAPALPDNSLLLATVAVGNGVTSIVDADITDERTYYQACSGAGGLIDTIVYTAGDTFDKADYPTMAYVEVEVQGSGGGGGGAAATTNSTGGGGGSGGYCRGQVLVASLAASETVTVGAGGAGGGGASDGANGATSSFGTHIVCAGGQGGEAQVPGTFAEGGPSGNVPTSPVGSIVVDGQYGAYGYTFDDNSGTAVTTCGDGGDTPLGLGGRGITRPDAIAGTFAGRDGTGYGSGGSGAQNTGSGNNTGGDGADGVVIVRVYG